MLSAGSPVDSSVIAAIDPQLSAMYSSRTARVPDGVRSPAAAGVGGWTASAAAARAAVAASATGGRIFMGVVPPCPRGAWCVWGTT